MKHMLFAALCLFSVPTFAQTSGQIEVDSAVFRNNNIGVLSFDVIVDQNLSDMNDHDLQKLKVSLVEGIFGGEGLKLTTSFLSLQSNTDRIGKDESYTVNQLQLISAKITSVVPLAQGFKVTLTAHAGLGFSVKGVINSDNEMLREAEYKLFNMVRDCTECLKEVVKDAGYMPIEAGLRVQLNKNNTYIALSADYRNSSKFYGIPGDELLPGVDSHRYRLYTAEKKSVIPLAAEVGQQFGPATLYGRAEMVKYRSSVDVSTDKFRLQDLDERSQTNTTFKVGVRVKFKSIIPN